MNKKELHEHLITNNQLEEFMLEINNSVKYNVLLHKYRTEHEIEHFKFLVDLDEFNYFNPIFKDFIITKSPRYTEVNEHDHEYIEMIYVYSGKLTQKINNQNITLNKGDICLLDTHCKHSLEYLDKDDIVINILLSKDFFDSIFVDLLYENDIISNLVIDSFYQNTTSRYIILKSSFNNEIQDIFTRILCEYYDKSVGSKTLIKGYILILFTLLLRLKKLSGLDNEVMKSDAIMMELNNYLKKNFMNTSLNDVAKHFNYSSSYMSNLIKTKTGKSFVDFLKEFKLKQACFLLKNTNLPTKQIILNIGYSNASYFYRIFKDYYNVTPIEYRKNNQ